MKGLNLVERVWDGERSSDEAFLIFSWQTQTGLLLSELFWYQESPSLKKEEQIKP